MGNLFASLDAAAGALRAFRDGISVSQNNVNNANTPGYAKQSIQLEAQPFELYTGQAGGVRTGAVEDSRVPFAERAVRQQLTALGNFSRQANSLTQIESVFDASGEGGIPAALNELFSAFAAFSSSPNSSAARQAVLDAAAKAGDSFNSAAKELARIWNDVDTQVRETVDKINEVAGHIQQYNRQVLDNAKPDTGLQALAYSDAESLSQLADVNIVFETNGTMTVLLGGQVPLVIGDQQLKIGTQTYTPSAPLNAGANPLLSVVDSAGRDVTNVVSGGELGGLLRVRTQILPAIAGDATQDGSLNTLAKHVADRVNEILTNGVVSDGPPPQAGVPLFTYTAGNGADVARSLAVDPNITADQLAAIDPGPPYVSNGTALQLADLRTSLQPADTINGVTILDFYSSIARGVGDSLATARQEEARANLLTTQARDLRQQLSGVSLDEEAVKLTEFQRSYEANAQVVKIVDELIQNLLTMLR